MADVVESLEVGWVRGPPKAVGAFLFFLNLGRVEGFGLDGNGRRAKREPDHVSFVRTVRTDMTTKYVQQHGMITKDNKKIWICIEK